MNRLRLPQRRPHKIIDFQQGGRRFTAGIGRSPDGHVAEVFINSAKTGTDLDTQARDAAIVASLLLQHGCPVDTIRHALTRNTDGIAAGPLGALLDLLATQHTANAHG